MFARQSLQFSVFNCNSIKKSIAILRQPPHPCLALRNDSSVPSVAAIGLPVKYVKRRSALRNNSSSGNSGSWGVNLPTWWFMWGNADDLHGFGISWWPYPASSRKVGKSKSSLRIKIWRGVILKVKKQMVLKIHCMLPEYFIHVSSGVFNEIPSTNYRFPTTCFLFLPYTLFKFFYLLCLPGFCFYIYSRIKEGFYSPKILFKGIDF